MLLSAGCNQIQNKLNSNNNITNTNDNTAKKIVLIAGEKSHPPGTHEYIKTVRLIKTMLDHSNISGLRTEVYLHGWPPNEKTLNDADLIFFLADGRDGELFEDVPFMTPERMKVMERQMSRGCGFALLHFATFASYAHGQKVLEWGGGYYDWEEPTGAYRKYSEIKTLEADVHLASPAHPVSRGVMPFRVEEEFYYNMRFRENDTRLTPILEVPALGGRAGLGNVVAWAVERSDGGRAFSATLNHFYSNWENTNYRKVLLNGLVWAAGAEVPPTGIETRFFSDQEVTEHLYQKTKKALQITDENAASSQYQIFSELIAAGIEEDSQFLVDMSANVNDLAQYDLRDYKVIILNRKDLNGMNSDSQKALESYLQQGGGLIATTFLLDSAASIANAERFKGWPAYTSIFRKESRTRKLNEQKKNQVQVSVAQHAVTSGLSNFDVAVPVGFCVVGTEPAVPLLLAVSGSAGKQQPLAWVYNFGRGRIFLTTIGHNAAVEEPAQVKRLWKNAAIWASRAEGF
ncbi:ThuA domain-containing protein [Pontibacter sp. 13R65]